MKMYKQIEATIPAQMTVSLRPRLTVLLPLLYHIFRNLWGVRERIKLDSPIDQQIVLSSLVNRQIALSSLINQQIDIDSEIEPSDLNLDADKDLQVDVKTMHEVPSFSDASDITRKALVDADRHPQIDVLSTANPPNIDIALSGMNVNISVQYVNYSIQSDGTNWVII